MKKKLPTGGYTPPPQQEVRSTILSFAASTAALILLLTLGLLHAVLADKYGWDVTLCIWIGLSLLALICVVLNRNTDISMKE